MSVGEYMCVRGGVQGKNLAHFTVGSAYYLAVVTHSSDLEL